MATLVRTGNPGGRHLLIDTADETIIAPSPPEGSIRRVIHLRAMNEDTVLSHTLKTRIKETDLDKIVLGADEYVPMYPKGLPALAPAEMRDDYPGADAEVTVLSPTQQIVEQLAATPTATDDGVAYLVSWIDEVGTL